MTKDELTNELIELSKVADAASTTIDNSMSVILTELGKMKSANADIRWVKASLRALETSLEKEPVKKEVNTVGFSTTKAIGEYIHMRSIRHMGHY